MNKKKNAIKNKIKKEFPEAYVSSNYKLGFAVIVIRNNFYHYSYDHDINEFIKNIKMDILLGAT